MASLTAQVPQRGPDRAGAPRTAPHPPRPARPRRRPEEAPTAQAPLVSQHGGCVSAAAGPPPGSGAGSGARAGAAAGPLLWLESRQVRQDRVEVAVCCPQASHGCRRAWRPSPAGNVRGRCPPAGGSSSSERPLRPAARGRSGGRGGRAARGRGGGRGRTVPAWTFLVFVSCVGIFCPSSWRFEIESSKSFINFWQRTISSYRSDPTQMNSSTFQMLEVGCQKVFRVSKVPCNCVLLLSCSLTCYGFKFIDPLCEGCVPGAVNVSISL